jgi:hypothetical protein
MGEPGASILLLLLISADVVFIVLHMIIAVFAPYSPLCNTQGICAYMNIYNVIKLFWIVVLFAYVFRARRSTHYLSWILVFTFLLLDDAFLLHQTIGTYLLEIWNTSSLQDIMPGQRFLELGVLAMAGILLLSVVAWSYLHGSPGFRKVSQDVVLFLLALAFLGLIVDLAEAMKLDRRVIFALGFVEDGGEMVVNSLLLWYVFRLALWKGKSELSTHHLVPTSDAAG